MKAGLGGHSRPVDLEAVLAGLGEGGAGLGLLAPRILLADATYSVAVSASFFARSVLRQQARDHAHGAARRR
jgi:hypothetical protein